MNTGFELDDDIFGCSSSWWEVQYYLRASAANCNRSDSHDGEELLPNFPPNYFEDGI